LGGGGGDLRGGGGEALGGGGGERRGEGGGGGGGGQSPGQEEKVSPVCGGAGREGEDRVQGAYEPESGNRICRQQTLSVSIAMSHSGPSLHFSAITHPSQMPALTRLAETVAAHRCPGWCAPPIDGGLSGVTLGLGHSKAAHTDICVARLGGVKADGQV
jgi:hypothetical protein